MSRLRITPVYAGIHHLGNRMVLEKRKPLLAYVISTFYLLIVAVTYTSLNPYLLKFGVWSSVIGFGVWIFYLYRSNKPLRYPKILLPIAGYMLLRFITTTQAPFPIISFEVALRELILLFGFVFVFNSFDLFWTSRTWEDTLINFALVFCFIELGLAFFWHRIWVDITGSLFPLPPTGYRAPGVFLGHPNILAGFLNLVAPIMVVRLIREKDWRKRLLWGLGLAIFLPTLYFTSSRTGLIAGLLGIAVTILLLFVPNLFNKLMDRGWKSLWEIVPPRIFVFVIILTAIVLSFVTFFLIQSQNVASHAPTIIAARSGIWPPAIEVIKKAPVLGHGPGSFSVFFANETQIPPGFATSHAHNLLLQITAETGLIGLAFVIWIILAGIVFFIRIWKEVSSDARYLLAAYVGAGAAILSHHSLDYLFESPLYALSVFILLGLVFRENPESNHQFTRGRNSTLVLVTLLIIFLAGSTFTSVGASNYWDGVNAGREGNWTVATEEICKAYEKRPEISLYGFQCSQAHAQLYYRNNDANELNSALKFQDDAIKHDPYWPIHWANLAELEWEDGKFDAAVISMQKAIDLAPMNATFLMNLSWMEEAQGNQEVAIKTSSQALSAYPWLQFDLIFETSPVSRDGLQQFLHEENDDSPWFPVVQGWMYLSANEWELAEKTFHEAIQSGAAEGRAYAGIAIALQMLGREEDASTNIQIATYLDSSSALVLHAAGVVAQQQGREDDALEYFQSVFNQIENLSYSASFYYRSYYRFFLPSDFVPRIRRGGLTPEIVDSMLQLAEHNEKLGKHDVALEIRNRIEVEIGYLPGQD